VPSLIDLRRRIRAVKNTQQITKAMKMVAASKLRRAQDRVISARPFATQMRRVLASVAARVDPSAHPLLAVRELTPESRALVIVVTADKGLCGSFNTNIIKGASGYISASPVSCMLGLVGRKGRDYFARRGVQVMFEQIGIFQKLQYSNAQMIAQTAIDAFITGKVDRVVMVYSEFKSIMTQRVTVEQVLPIQQSELPAEAAESQVDYLYEPSPQEIFNQLMPRYVEVQIYRALLESNAGFFGAQMTAMDTATKNSADMLKSLTLFMNKVRQAQITREIIEVVSGAEAL
jgi:F-type H+-transporting ATPase subunit gamma